MSYSHDNVIDKLLKLNERVAVSNYTDDHEKDLLWCQRLITDVKDSGLVPSKEEFIMANLMWHKYGVLPTERKSTEENMWKLVDSMLTQENPSKIGAIKMYRRFINSTLKEAKEMVDAREIKIKKEWKMRPTKRTKVHRVKPELSKLMKLKYRINDAYNAGRDTDKSDKDWVMEEIDNLRQGGWLSATKMKVANEMWSKYGG